MVEASGEKSTRIVNSESWGDNLSESGLNEALSGLPLYFIENQGQLDSRVGYYLQGRAASAIGAGLGRAKPKAKAIRIINRLMKSSYEFLKHYEIGVMNSIARIRDMLCPHRINRFEPAS